MQPNFNKLFLIFPFASWRSFLFVLLLSVIAVISVALIEKQIDVRLFFIFISAWIGGSGVLYFILPYTVFIDIKKLENKLIDIDAFLNKVNYEKGNDFYPLVYYPKIPMIFRWKESFVCIEVESDGIKICGPKFILQILTDELTKTFGDNL